MSGLIEKMLTTADIGRLSGEQPTKQNWEKVRRRLQRVEKRIGEQLLHHNGAHYYTTLTLLKQHAPGLVPLDDELPTKVAKLESHVAELQGQLAAIVKAIRPVGGT